MNKIIEKTVEPNKIEVGSTFLLKIKVDDSIETREVQGTNIYINDSAASRIVRLKLLGNSIQEETPTPSSPALIKSAGDAKNIYYLPEAGTSNGITYTINEDGTINLSGTATANATFPIFKSIAEAQIENGATYTFSSNQALPSGVEFRTEAYSGTSWLRYLIGSVLNSSYQVFTGTANLANATRIRHLIYIASGTTVNIENLGIQFEKGSTPSSFASEGKGFINETISNKNLFNKSTILEKHLIDSSGNIVSDNYNFVSDYIGIANNRQFVISASTNKAKRIGYYDNSKSFISRAVISNYSGQLTIPTNAVFCRLSCHNDDLSTLQLEVGESASTYIEHQEQVFTMPCQQPMRSIGDVRDSFIKVNGVWNERHYIGEIILDGSETGWSAGGPASNCYFSNRSVIKDIAKKPDDSEIKANMLSDRFIVKSDLEVRNKTEDGIAIDIRGYLQLYFKEYRSSNATLFKNWLSENNMKLIFELIEPIDLECTQEQIQALESIAQSRTYEPITNTYSTDENPAYLDLIYYKKEE